MKSFLVGQNRILKKILRFENSCILDARFHYRLEIIRAVLQWKTKVLSFPFFVVSSIKFCKKQNLLMMYGPPMFNSIF